MFPANRHDTVAFRKTMDEFLNISEEEWLIIIGDSGAYSLKNLESLQLRGILPIIRARKNIKTHPVKELKKGYYFNTDYIPKEWSTEYFLKICHFRPMIEQGNSYNNTYYNASRMNTYNISIENKYKKWTSKIKFQNYIFIEKDSI